MTVPGGSPAGGILGAHTRPLDQHFLSPSCIPFSPDGLWWAGEGPGQGEVVVRAGLRGRQGTAKGKSCKPRARPEGDPSRAARWGRAHLIRDVDVHVLTEGVALGGPRGAVLDQVGRP